MIQKFEFTELDLKGAYLIKPFSRTTTAAALSRIII